MTDTLKTVGGDVQTLASSVKTFGDTMTALSGQLSGVNDKLDSIQRITLIGAKTVLDLEETCLFTGLSKGHLYRLTSGRQIPFFRKNRKLYFKKTDLENWMTETPCASLKDINSQAATYCSTRQMR